MLTKAWLCTIHPEYIRHSLANKIAPHDLNVLKEKYNYESRKRDPSAPWHNFVKRLPKLIQEAHLTTPQAQQPQEPQEPQEPPTPPSLQERYDALLKKNADLVETNKALTTNAFKANKQLQDITLKYNKLKTDWNSYTEHLQQEVESYKKDLNLKYDELRTNFKRTREELIETRNNFYYFAQKSRTLANQIQDLKQEKQQIYNLSTILHHTTSHKKHSMHSKPNTKTQTHSFKNFHSHVQSLRKPSLNQSLLSMVEHMKNPPSSAGSRIATNLLKLEKNYPPHYSFPICLLEYSLRNSIIIRTTL